MPSLKKNTLKMKPIRAKKEKAQLEEGKGKVGDKGLRKEAPKAFIKELTGDKGDGKVGGNGKGNEAVTATVRPKTGLGKKAVTAKLQQGEGKVGDKGMDSACSYIVGGKVLGKFNEFNGFIAKVNVKVNKFDGFSVFIQEKDSIEAFKAKIRMRARDLQIKLPSSNFELNAGPLMGCMDQKLIACKNWSLIFEKQNLQFEYAAIHASHTLKNGDTLYFAPAAVHHSWCTRCGACNIDGSLRALKAKCPGVAAQGDEDVVRAPRTSSSSSSSSHTSQ